MSGFASPQIESMGSGVFTTTAVVVAATAAVDTATTVATCDAGEIEWRLQMSGKDNEKIELTEYLPPTDAAVTPAVAAAAAELAAAPVGRYVIRF